MVELGESCSLERVKLLEDEMFYNRKRHNGIQRPDQVLAHAMVDSEMENCAESNPVPSRHGIYDIKS